MEIKRLPTLAIEIFKTINNIIPIFMKDIFILKTDPKIRSYDVFVKLYKSAKYGEKVLIVLVNLTLLGIFWGCSRMGGGSPLPKTCHTYPTKIKLSTVIPYLRRLKNI